MRELLNRSREHWALIRRNDGANSPNLNLAVFIHGFRGGYLDTWGKTADLLKQYADHDSILAPWDFLFLGYSTREVETYLDIANLICTNWRRAAAGDLPFRTPYRKLALLGHSLGTLGIRQLLCATSQHQCDLIGALHSVTLFGTPLNGSPWAPIGALAYTIGDALKPNSPQLRMLKVWTEGAFATQPWPPVRIILGMGDAVVGHSYSDLMQWHGDVSVDKVNLDHRAMVKPDSFHSDAMDNFRRALRTQP